MNSTTRKPSQMFNDEYPLFNHTAAERCPSARYVGGVLGWLCECAAPLECAGVALANSGKSLTTWTRKEHLDGHCSHDQYYAQFLTPAYVNRVTAAIGRDRIVNSSHLHFSDIPLKEWDCIRMDSTHAAQLRELDDIPTRSSAVCIAKRAAKQVRRENAQPQKWALTVKYRKADGRCGTILTQAHGTIDGIFDYYTQSPLNVGTVEDEMVKVFDVEFERLDA